MMRTLLASGLLLAVVLLVFWWPSEPASAPAEAIPVEPVALQQPALDAFGFEAGLLETVERRIRRNETFSDILSDYAIAPQQIAELAERARDVFSVRYIQAGKPLHIYRADDSLGTAQHVVYQQDPVNYVVFDLSDSIHVYTGRRPVEVRERRVEGRIKGSLYATLADLGVSPALAVELSEVFAWQIDFFRIQRGDAFSVVYEERLIDDQPIGVGDVLAVRFSHIGEDYYAFRYEYDEGAGYFDEDGHSLRKAFLKAPLKFYRLTSRYNPNRYHPVLKRRKAHLGTDYAAPRGTPIRATGDGIITAAGYTRGNGNYIKIRHNSTYTTGYLHMSKFADGIRNGIRVRQGDVIGYVGSTGLATGPHVCYRFWKHGTQVDPLREKIPPAYPVPDEQRIAFEAERDQWIAELRLPGAPQIAMETSLPEPQAR